MIGRGLGQTSTCSPFSDTNCPWYCLWATSPECSSNPQIRAAAPSYLCSIPGSSVLTTCAYPSTPAPVPPVGPPNPAQTTDWNPTTAIDLTAQAQKNQMLNFFGQVSAANPPAGPPDCTSFWTALTNTSCWPVDPTTMLLIGAGVLALVLMRR